MPVQYLKGRRWSDWTRDERFFCSALYHLAKEDPAKLVSFVNWEEGRSLSASGTWDLGYEVSFYRDYLWQKSLKPSDFGVSNQRAFDLCLFGEHAVVVIEAKVFEPFSGPQNQVFGLDKQHINRLPGLEQSRFDWSH